MAAESERTLKIINGLWDDNNERFQGVEGLLKVEISPRRHSDGPDIHIEGRGKAADGDGESVRDEVEGKFFDDREVQTWSLVQDNYFPRQLIWGSQRRPSK